MFRRWQWPARPARWIHDGRSLRLGGGRTTDDQTSTTGTVYLTGQPVHVSDWDEIPADHYPNSRARESGARTLLALPMRRRGDVVGVMTFTRVRAGGYGDDEISLLQAFTDQAAIAVDNARLLREIEERNSELTESLELQTATSEALRLISTHPGDLTTVLDAIVTKAADLCDAPFGSVLLKDGPVLRISAAKIDSDLDMAIGMEFPADDGNVNTHAAASNTALAFDDLHVIAPELAETFPNSRSYATVALFSEAEWIGNINIVRPEVHPFDDAELKILQAFADQASLAVSNARLFNDLDAALERQTAMTDVLDAVSTARFDLQPVFDRVVHHAQRLCEDTSVIVHMRTLDQNEVVAIATELETQTMPPGWRNSWGVNDGTTTGAVYATGESLHIKDWDELPPDEYPRSQMRGTGVRSQLTLPLSHGGDVFGALTFIRVAPGGFTDVEVTLLKAFADQAAIAVDNARLLAEIEERNTELSESLELQTATSEVLRLISANPGDLTVVLEGMIARATALCEAEAGLLWLRRGDELRCEAEVRQLVSYVGDVTIPTGSRLRSAELRKPVFLDDILPGMVAEGRPLTEKTIEAGIRSYATIALLHDDEWIGSIDLGRREVRPFDASDATILQAFADQAAIAVANARLFNDLDAALERRDRDDRRARCGQHVSAGSLARLRCGRPPCRPALLRDRRDHHDSRRWRTPDGGAERPSTH